MTTTAESPVYQHFERCVVLENGASVECMRCKLCGVSIAGVKRAANLERHLEKRHPQSPEWQAYPSQKAEWMKQTGRDNWKKVSTAVPSNDEQKYVFGCLQNCLNHCQSYSLSQDKTVTMHRARL